MPVGAERHTGHRAGVAGDNFQGAGPLGHRGVEGAVDDGVVRGQRVGGQDLLESPHVPAGDGAGQHALGPGDQLRHGRGPQIGLGLIPGELGLIPEVNGHDDGRCEGRHGSNRVGESDAGAFAQRVCAPPVAVFADDAREHIVGQFDPWRAVVFLDP